MEHACLTRIFKKPLECREQAKNLVVKEALSKRATELGYVVTTNEKVSPIPLESNHQDTRGQDQTLLYTTPDKTHSGEK